MTTLLHATRGLRPKRGASSPALGLRQGPRAQEHVARRVRRLQGPRHLLGLSHGEVVGGLGRVSDEPVTRVQVTDVAVFPQLDAADLVARLLDRDEPNSRGALEAERRQWLGVGGQMYIAVCTSLQSNIGWN